jgi:iron complex transport system permease protein
VTFLKLVLYFLCGAVALAAVGLVCALVGPLKLKWQVVYDLRLGRILAAATVGAGLSAAGMALQALLRNPLAEPYILGISSGAGVGVGLGPLLAAAAGLGAVMTTSSLALAGALGTCLLVYGIAQRRGRLDPYVLLLSGVIINVFNGALMLVILLLGDPNKVIDFVRWGMGRMPEMPDFGDLGYKAGVVVAGWAWLFLLGNQFNTLGLGDAVASSSGVSVHRLRVETFIVVGLITSVCVARAGPIGFVGLIVPHVCRMIFGADHRTLAIVSGFVGAMFLVVADTLCRTIGPMLSIGEIPVGVLTAILGGPFFILLLRRRSGQVRV